MKLGIDLGTTRTLVASVDRGNYPVVSFIDDEGDAHEHFPSVVACKNGALVYGFDALAAARDGAPLLRSFKRVLADASVTGDSPVNVGGVEVRVADLLVGFLRALDEALRKHSNLARRKWSDDTSAVIAVPAHAHGAQRFITLDAFRRAGFDVKAMINEPSAAGFEYTHCQGKTVNARRTRVVVYDLGGGTFDASLVKVDGVHHDVLGTAGLNRLGGDDFDVALARCALREAGVKGAALEDRVRALYRGDDAALLSQCRDAKERITPQTKRVSLDVPALKRGAPEIVEVNVAVDDFYEAAAPLVEETVEAMRPILGKLDDDDGLSDIAGIYLVGGGSGLPLVPRVLKERFGRRVHRSPHPAASTAIGLAIAADEEAGFSLADRLSRSFGVFREGNDGKAVRFDPIFVNDTSVAGVVEVSRRYRAAHNVGHFRFVECTSVDDGEPRGDLVPFAEVIFAFDPAVRGRTDLRDIPVERSSGAGPVIEERYLVGQNGIVEVVIADLTTGFEQSYRIGGVTS